MGTRCVLVFRVRGKVVLQVHTQGDGYPTGYPQKVANLLMRLVGEVNVHAFIMQLIAQLKEDVGTIYVRPVNAGYASKDNYPFMEYCYVFDFGDKVSIDCRECCGPWSRHDIAGFAKKCGLSEEKKSQQPPPLVLNYDEPSEADVEMVEMLDEDGDCMFMMKARNWRARVAEFALGCKLINGMMGGENLGGHANGAQCLAAQIVKHTYETSNMGTGAVLTSELPRNFGGVRHTIAFYGVSDVTAIHVEERDKTIMVHGIHSEQEDGTVILTKARLHPPRPVGKRKREHSPGKKIRVTKFNRSKDDPPINVGDHGTLVLEDHSRQLFFFDTEQYRGEFMNHDPIGFSFEEESTAE